MTYRVRNIGIAVALAAVAALLTSFYVTNYKRHVQRGQDSVTVLVAKHDIQPGTAGSDVSLAPESVPRRSVVPGAISNQDEIHNLVASQETFAGEQVTTQRFSAVAESGVRGQLKGTLRAYQVQGDANQLLAGTLKTGDHVDLVAAVKISRGSSNDVVLSRVVLRDLKVLSAPSGPPASSKLTGGVSQSFSALLQMTDSQAQKYQLILAETEGESNGSGWHLALRPVVHDADSPDHVDNVWSVLLDGLNAYQRRVARGG